VTRATCPFCDLGGIVHREGCPVLASSRAWGSVRAAIEAWAWWVWHDSFTTSSERRPS
jgi:hypothetical protein